MKLIVGLGNYGPEYSRTRHNIGFMAAELIAERLQTEFSRESFHGKIAEARLGGEKILLLKPLTYMNRSGLCVGEAAAFYKIPPEDILIIYDDMDMACSQLKIKKKGSAGGHRGMGDIITAIGTQELNRIKIGIDHPLFGTVVDYVLTPFSKEEWEQIEPTLQAAAKAACLWAEEGVERAMSAYNGYGTERRD